jgi:hypothetical protein
MQRWGGGKVLRRWTAGVVAILFAKFVVMATSVIISMLMIVPKVMQDEPARVSVPPIAGVPEIESVVVGVDQAVVKQREFHSEGMLITFGPMTNRWEPGSVYFEHMFDVTLGWPWFGHGANWVVKGRNGIYAFYRLDGPPGPMLGKIVFHPGRPAPEADGSYVIGEFKPETGVALPIAVRLVRDSKPSASPAATAAVPSLVSKSIVDSARTNLTLINARYNAGIVDRLDVIEAEQDLHWAEAMFAGDRKAAAIAKRDCAKAKLALMADKVKAGVLDPAKTAPVERELAESEALLSELGSVPPRAPPPALAAAKPAVEKTAHAQGAYDYRTSEAYRKLSPEDREKLGQVHRDFLTLWKALDEYADSHNDNPPDSLDELVRSNRELPTDPFATAETARQTNTSSYVTSKHGWGYRYLKGAPGNQAWCLASVGLPGFPYLAETNNYGLYVCKGFWSGGNNLTFIKEKAKPGKPDAKDAGSNAPPAAAVPAPIASQ